MSKVTHTHRGHCQVCLRVQAIDVVTGLIAKHGYEVAHGMFRGQCPGSGYATLHTARGLTDSVIDAYRRAQAEHKKTADEYEAGIVVPSTVWECRNFNTPAKPYWTGEHVKVMKPNPRKPGTEHEVSVRKMIAWADANDEQRARQVKEIVDEARSDERHAKGHADMMVRYATEIFEGKVPAYRNEDLDSFVKVGMTVQLGGDKNGFECVVEEIAEGEYTTFGYSRGRQTIMIPHAKVTRPAIADTLTKAGKVKKAGRPAKTYWEPVRNIKAPKGSLVDRLKADELI